MKNDILVKAIRLLIPCTLLAVLLVLSYRVLNELLMPLTWAIIIAYVMWPIYQWLRHQLDNKDTLSAGVMTCLMTIVITLSLYCLGTLLQNETKLAYQSLSINFTSNSYHLPQPISQIPWLGQHLQTVIDQFIDNQAEFSSQLTNWVGQWLGELTQLISSIGRNIMKLGVILVTVFFCFRDGLTIIKQLQQGLISFLGPYQQIYLQTAGATTRAVVYGLVLAALSQGLLAGIGYAVVGIKAPLLFGLMTALLAIIPMGATLIWLPLSIILIVSNQFWSGIGLLLWGFLAVSTIDNVVRPLVISGAGRVPFPIVLFGVLGGLSAFGAIGIFLGPVILAVLLSVWQAWLQLQQKEDVSVDRSQPIWHSLSTEAVIQELTSNSILGLSADEANKRLKQYGANRLTEIAPRSALHLLLSQFKGILILVLLAAALLATTIGDIKDGLVILVVVIINALLGFYQEFQAEKSLTALKNMLPLQSIVRRNGQTLEILADQLVLGDIVILEAGRKIPADGRILFAQALEVDESSLTGESTPITKHHSKLEKTSLALAERSNMLYMNSSVTHGHGEMIVTATGMNTEIGKLANLLAQTEEGATPLQAQLDSLGKRLAVCALAIIVMLFMSALVRGEPLLLTAFNTIALAVAAIPEGLPAVVTVTLALGMHRMARQRAIVKRLASVETLGCTTVICTDKTGTLTVNQMTVRTFFYKNQHYKVSGEGYKLSGKISPNCSPEEDSNLLLPLVLCNNSHVRGDQVLGDPMEAALLVLAAKAGINQKQVIDQWPRIAEIPFDAKHKFMATFHQKGDEIKVFVKGAPEVLLKLCQTTTHDHQYLEDTFLAQNELIASAGYRVLGVAETTLPSTSFQTDADLFHYIKSLNFIALIGLMDPPRAEVKGAIKLCRQAGIAVKMITGDQKITAVAIAQELGLMANVIEGEALAALNDLALANCINTIDVFARITPEQKVRIIKALKANNHIVAMTGDGVNDAPALKIADIGIAMGITGTNVAQDAATIILTDDNFTTIVMAVKEGRNVYDNIVKFVRFQLSTNIGAILTVALAPLLGLPVPFTAIQLLWINIIMDGPPALSLGVDPAHTESMLAAPREHNERILSWPRLANLLSYGIIMAIGTLGVLYFGLQTGDHLHATSLAFTTFVLFQVINVFNARSEKTSVFNRDLFSNKILCLAITLVLLLQIVVIHWPPAQILFHTTALTLTDWLIASSVAISILFFEELRKLIMPFHPKLKSNSTSANENIKI